MMESEWNASTDPIEMIEFLRGNPTSEDTVTWWHLARMCCWRPGKGFQTAKKPGEFLLNFQGAGASNGLLRRKQR